MLSPSQKIIRSITLFFGTDCLICLSVVCSFAPLFFKDGNQTRETVFRRDIQTRGVKKTTHSGAFLTKFEVFG